MLLTKTALNQPVRQEVRRDLFHVFDDFLDQWWTESPNALFVKERFENFRPAVNLKETPTHYLVEVEVPGLSKEDLDVSLKDHFLHIKGEKKFNREDQEHYHRLESAYGQFLRTVALPESFEASQVSAELKEGLLKVQVKKSEKASGQSQISIQ